MQTLLCIFNSSRGVGRLREVVRNLSTHSPFMNIGAGLGVASAGLMIELVGWVYSHRCIVSRILDSTHRLEVSWC